MRHFLGLASCRPFVTSGAGGFQVLVSHVCRESKGECRTYRDALVKYYYKSVLGVTKSDDFSHSRYYLQLEESIADAPMRGYELQKTG